MSVDIVVSNNALSYLNQVNRKRKLTNFIAEENTAAEPSFSPAYIVELSAEGKQLQQANQVSIVKNPYQPLAKHSFDLKQV